MAFRVSTRARAAGCRPHDSARQTLGQGTPSGLVFRDRAGRQAGGQAGPSATVHPAATQAGLDALQAVGNTIADTLACTRTLGVVDGHDSSRGGSYFILIRPANGWTVAVDRREAARATARRDLCLRDGKADPSLRQDCR